MFDSENKKWTVYITVTGYVCTKQTDRLASAVYIGGLSDDMTKDELRDLFLRYGTVTKVRGYVDT